MSELNLFLDVYETEYPSLVREVLSQATQKMNICATLTPQQICVLICGNTLYLWKSTNKNRVTPHAFRYQLPSSGLKYTASSVCVFKRSNSPPALLVVSPEGLVRYWSEAGKPHRDQTLQLTNDVALDISQIEALGHVERFLISTATSNFYIFEIFHSSGDQTERISIRQADMDTPDGIGRRMSKILFGSSSEKQSVLKTIFIKGKLKAKEVDIITIMPKSLRFFSMTKRSLLHETNIVKLFVDTIQSQTGDKSQIKKDVSILDAAIYRKGILMLIAAISSAQTHQSCNGLAFYLGFLEGKREISSMFDSLVPILLPESMASMDILEINRCKLLVPNNDECTILLPKSLILVRRPTKESVHAAVLENIDDVLLGTSCVNGICHFILKETGICALRRLPKNFDLSFWKKYGLELENVLNEPFGDDLFKQAFVVFCSKDLADSKEFVNELISKPEINYSELAVELAKFFCDKQPLGDPRWSSKDGHFHSDQTNWVREHATNKNLPLIVEQLEDKLIHYRMFILFLQHFNLLEKMDRPVQNFHNRSGTVVLAELGEKIVLMMLCAKWLSENSVPLISESFKSLSKEFIRRFAHPENQYITHFDHVFNEVSSFHEIVPAVVQACEKELKENCQSIERHNRIITEVSAFLAILAEGVDEFHQEDWALKTPQGVPTWLNHSQFLTYFIRHLNVILEYLCDKFDDFDSTLNTPLMEQAIRLARFVLSQQTRWQRDNSSIIGKFYSIGKTEIALNLAEEFQDFTHIIEHCHKNLDEKNCKKELDEYKRKYEAEDFDLFLYEYYREKGMVNYLLAEKGNRLNDFLSAHENINWIKNIDNGEYQKARRTLKAMAFETKDPEKKLTEISLCKLCALCDDKIDVAELAELSASIRELSDEPQ